MPIRNLAVLMVALILSVAAFSQKPAAPPASSQPTASRLVPDDDKDTVALRAELQNMRSILVQMQNNLAFVQTTQTPLKHQFELEVEMWQIAINQAERRLQARESHPQK
jgi:hypothetical protein